MSSVPRTSDIEVERLFVAYRRRGDLGAREALIRRFIPFARQLAGRHRSAAAEPEDLAQVAALGLIKAVDRYDAARGVRFTSFAAPTIVGELKRHLRDKTWAVHVPRDLQERALLVAKSSAAMASRLGRSPTVRELARELGTSVAQVRKAHTALRGLRADSLDRPIGDGEDAGDPRIDHLGGNDAGYDGVEARDTAARYLRSLPTRERTILALRFHGAFTQTEIAERVGCSQMHVSRLIRHSLECLHGLAVDSEASEDTSDRAAQSGVS